MKFIGMLAAAVMAAMTLTGRAAEYYVASDGSDGNGGTGWTDAKATIAAGVALATSGGDTVLVSNGTYTLSAEVVVSAGITVRSWNNGALDESGTIVDGNAVTRCFQLTHAGAVLAGFTVQNGAHQNGTNETVGSGVYVSGGGTVTQCVLSANSAMKGAGLYIYNGGLVTHSTLRENVAVSNAAFSSRGGGVYLHQFGVVSNCVVVNNTVASKYATQTPYSYNYSGGGGIATYGTLTTHVCRVYDSLIASNFSDYSGGGIFVYHSKSDLRPAVVSDSTVAYNTADSQYGGGVFSLYGKPAGLLTGCLIENNVAKGSGGGVGSLGSITARDCTLRGNTASSMGGGAHAANCYDCLIESNVTAYWGGGVFIANITSNITVSNCVIRGNSAPENNGAGGGVLLYGGGGYNADVINCRIHDNMASNSAGGINLSIANYNPFSVRVYGCLIYNNVCREGGGVRLAGSGYVVSACTIVSNLAALSGGGVYFSIGDMTNCIVYSNLCVANPARNDFYFYTAAYTDKVWYSCAPVDLPSGQGNITGEPQFADFGAADFRLTANSPCVNAGTNEPWMENTLDLDGRARLDPFTGLADIGAYELLPEGALFKLR